MRQTSPIFNARAESYGQSAVVQRDLARWLAEWLEPAAVSAPLTAWELGAGDGLFTQSLVGRFAKLEALDIAPRMVDRGRRSLPSVGWRIADAWSAAPRHGELVDRLYSASLLQWCEDPLRVLRHWRSHVPRGGRMLHGFYVAPTLVEWQTAASAPSPIRWFSAMQWLAIFQLAGWRVLRSEASTRVHRFASALDLLRFFHHTGSATPRTTPIGALRAMLADYDRRFGRNDGYGGVITTWTYFRIEAGSD